MRQAGIAQCRVTERISGSRVCADPEAWILSQQSAADLASFLDAIERCEGDGQDPERRSIRLVLTRRHARPFQSFLVGPGGVMRHREEAVIDIQVTVEWRETHGALRPLDGLPAASHIAESAAGQNPG